MRKLPLSLESLYVGVIYEVDGDKYQLIKEYKGRRYTFDLVKIGGVLDGKTFTEYEFRHPFWENPNRFSLWYPEPLLSLEDML